ncbi:APC family permease [Brevibacterium yomogidense]|uniref:APC family permease n=1 Tax=Brevibacterium yomogidense TaxID=946573 RepID=UPI0018DF5EE0|nr:APC family permease [Brevibacterium yomogidense]
MSRPTDSKYAHAEHSESGLVKVLGSRDALFVGFGAMIGFGWIVLTSGWLQDAGTLGAMLAFAAGGIIMIFVGLVYSELVAAMPFAGGEHNYLLRGMGPRAAVFGSWAITGGYISVVMFEAVAIPQTIEYLVPNLSQIYLWNFAGSDVYLTWALVGSAAALLIGWVNIRGIREASLVQTFVVSFLLLVGVLLIVGTAVGAEPSNAQPLFTGGVPGMIAVLVAVPFLFVGFDVIPQSAEEVNIPPRRVGALVVVSVLMAIAWYLLIIFTSSMAIPSAELGNYELVTADALIALLGHDFWGAVVIAGGLAGIITSWNAFLIGASRLMFSMARARMIPLWFGKLHPKYRTPSNAVLFISALAFIAPFMGSGMLGWIVDAGSPAIIIAYFMVSIVFLVLRRTEPRMDRPMRVGGRGNVGGVIIGCMSVVLTALLLFIYIPVTPWSAQLEWPSWVMFGGWMLLGIYFLVRLPGGIRPGEQAEDQLITAVKAKRGE